MKKQLELKVLAEKLFKDKKKSYPQSIGPRFIEDRLNEEQKPLRQNFQANHLNGEKIIVSSSSSLFLVLLKTFYTKDKYFTVKRDGANLIPQAREFQYPK